MKEFKYDFSISVIKLYDSRLFKQTVVHIYLSV